MFKALKATLLMTLLTVTGQQAFANDDYANAIKSFKEANESALFFNNSYGYAVFPTIGKGGMGIGGAHGKGQVYTQNGLVGKTTMTQLTVGFQLGGQAFSQIIFFENENAFREFTTGNFEFSAQASAVAITAGVSAEANTGGGVGAGASGGSQNATNAHAGYRKGMAIFTIAKGGLMYEAALGGQKFTYAPL